ncbi:MAG: BamA/TamA family outer membrane protein [Pseudomonadota bacterium]|nr:BamA/TamA family outer membrane protein [Pseudomonadota bacterium]
MRATGTRNGARRVLGVGCAALAFAQPLFAQQSPPPPTPPPGAEIDPNAPLDAMPDLGVGWPDMNAPDPLPEVADAPLPPLAGDATEPEARAEAVMVDDGVSARRYAVTLAGLDAVEGGDAIAAAFEEQSALAEGRKTTANAAQIDRRTRADVELLTELLTAQGYYDAEVEPDIAVGASSIAISLRAAPGRRYRFEAVELPGLGAAGGEAGSLRASFAVKAGDPVVAEQVIAAGTALRVALGEQGFATASVGEQSIVLDSERGVARLSLPVTPGPVGRFGTIRVNGTPPFSARHVGLIARFKKGDRFERSEVDDLRRALVATGLVAQAEVTTVPVAGGSVIDLDIKLVPAPARTVAGELGYGTGEGIRAEASWQHRNFFNPEGALTLRGVAGTQEQVAAISFRRNNFVRRDQVLNAQALVSHIDRKAYEARTVSLSGGIERQSNFIWQKKWTWSLGAELIATKERDTIIATGVERERTFFIGAIPASLGYDATDDLLDPTRGFRLLGRISPELSFEGRAFGYARAQIDASAYRGVRENVVLAGRVRVGTIAGAGRDEIAPSRRFYAGGGGSVRGYGYQRLGPRDIDGNPVGGSSLAEFGLEARIRLKQFGGNFGIVPFIDGGTLTTGSVPKLGNWQLGAGIGLRYYSSFGPIRIDVGTPLNRQEDDSRVAVTVSLGQAF